MNMIPHLLHTSAMGMVGMPAEDTISLYFEVNDCVPGKYECAQSEPPTNWTTDVNESTGTGVELTCCNRIPIY